MSKKAFVLYSLNENGQMVISKDTPAFVSELEAQVIADKLGLFVYDIGVYVSAESYNNHVGNEQIKQVLPNRDNLKALKETQQQATDTSFEKENNEDIAVSEDASVLEDLDVIAPSAEEVQQPGGVARKVIGDAGRRSQQESLNALNSVVRADEIGSLSEELEESRDQILEKEKDYRFNSKLG